MLELNKIYNENCLDTMSKMSDNFIDLTVTSPPYDSLKDYDGYSFEFEKIAQELYRVTKNGGVIVWIVNDETNKGDESGTSFRQALYFKEIGFNLHDTMIWHKPNSFNFGSNACYRQSFEYMFVLSKGKIKTVNLIKDVPTKMAGKTVKGARKHSNGERDTDVPDFVVPKTKKRDNVWGVLVAQGRNYNHPAVFPEELVSDHIISWSNPGDLIYDPFMGSGTTAKMAILNNRGFIGSEISSEYCQSANNRIEPYIKQAKLNLFS
ncbi:MAG TPA: site-specific DNA-methyltransferase [Candidatus Methanomethylophilaceae archaeon]|nr:site-specific DNA-methyltransferase [Candidatus Methanomethylophilaceae archaeon]